jgi:uncharacterized protein YbcC (UPF0753/DUF2309 family)
MEDVLQLAGVMTTLLLTVLGGWAGYIALRKWEKGTQGASPRELAAVNERLAQLELSMETLTLEIERMTESQRFTAKLLAERAPSLGAPSVGEPVAERRVEARTAPVGEPR